MNDMSYILLEKEDDEKCFRNYMLETTNDGLVKICRENVFKVNAMIRSNSSYKRTIMVESIPVLKSKRIEDLICIIQDVSSTMKKGDYYIGTEDLVSEINKTDTDVFKYYGSPAYWFSKLRDYLFGEKDLSTDTEVEILTTSNKRKIEVSFGYILYKTICAVDSTNSTHLNADGIGRALLAKRLFDMAKSKKLLGYLKKPEYKMIVVLSKEGGKVEGFLTDKGKKGQSPRFNLSFATKWCHYACRHLFDEKCEEERKYRDNFAKIDGVVKEALQDYEKMINNGRETPLDFSILKDNKTICERYEDYIAIIDAVRCSGEQPISRNGLDHLLWYGNKGLGDTESED